MGIEVRSHKRPKPEKEFEIEMVLLKDLIPHEETIDQELKWFIDAVQESGMVYWPMLIAHGSHLILDGHHRHAGLRALNFVNAPAIMIDYMDDELIQLDTWYPLIQQSVQHVISTL